MFGLAVLKHREKLLYFLMIFSQKKSLKLSFKAFSGRGGSPEASGEPAIFFNDF